MSAQPREVVEAAEEFGKDMFDAKLPAPQIIPPWLHHTHLRGMGNKICHISNGMRSAWTREEMSATVKGFNPRKSSGLEAIAGQIFKVMVQSPGLCERMGDGGQEV